MPAFYCSISPTTASSDIIKSVTERFPIECRKTKTKVITLANRERSKQRNETIRIRNKYM